MPLDKTYDALRIRDGNVALTASGSDFFLEVTRIIDEGFQQALVKNGYVDISPPAGSLYFIPQPGLTLPRIIGIECARYWSEAIGLGTDALVVTNDADKIAVPIENNLLALPTRKYTLPAFEEFIEAIHVEVRTIVWDITTIALASDTDSVS